MKMVYAIVSGDSVNDVIWALNKMKYKVTKLSSAGGFLRRKKATLMIGIEDEQMNSVIDIIESVCKERRFIEANTPWILSVCSHTAKSSGYPKEVEVGGAVILVSEMTYFKMI